MNADWLPPPVLSFPCAGTDSLLSLLAILLFFFWFAALLFTANGTARGNFSVSIKAIVRLLNWTYCFARRSPDISKPKSSRIIPGVGLTCAACTLDNYYWRILGRLLKRSRTPYKVAVERETHVTTDARSIFIKFTLWEKNTMLGLKHRLPSPN